VAILWESIHPLPWTFGHLAETMVDFNGALMPIVFACGTPVMPVARANQPRCAICMALSYADIQGL
jgi:hypothetical protein